MRVAAHKGLYDISADRPVRQGSRCASCNTTFFPVLSLGCEVCGSTQLDAIVLEATGVLHSVATVHLYQGHDIEAPFAIGEIQLDAGPLIRRVRLEWSSPAIKGDDNDHGNHHDDRRKPERQQQAQLLRQGPARLRQDSPELSAC